MRETPQALRAFEDYWALGDGRSLTKLAEKYRSGTGGVPTRQLSRLHEWSQRHGWQERIKSRITDQAEAVAVEQAKQLADIKAQLVADGIEAERLAMAALRLAAERGKLGAMAAVMMLPQARAAMLRGLDQPETVARQETTGSGGGPIEVKSEQRHEFDFDGFARAFDGLIGAGRGDGANPADSPGESLDTAHADAEAGALPGAAGS